MRILGIDFGEKRIGLAISDPLGITAQPLAVVAKSADFAADIKAILTLTERFEKLDEIIVGLPRTMKGEIGQQARKVMEFVEALKRSQPAPVRTWDERLTTVEAERTLIFAGLSRQKRKQVIDRSAASYILQSYLDSRK
ncbi:MAG: Holliday junction resolvase RuvX [Candidatus Saganbacteria bacterium]|nr:Holliday junction resolvase RuvX [Candidatus Saganbacteria bacterium]